MTNKELEDIFISEVTYLRLNGYRVYFDNYSKGLQIKKDDKHYTITFISDSDQEFMLIDWKHPHPITRATVIEEFKKNLLSTIEGF